jgi:hypothetical protein
MGLAGIPATPTNHALHLTRPAQRLFEIRN